MKKSLQEQYLLIKEGKGHKDVFMKEAKKLLPNQFRNAATFEEIVGGLKHKNIISENVVSIGAINQLPSSNKESFEVAFEKFLKESQEEAEKAELKNPSKQVEEDLSKNFDREDKSNPDNLIFDQIMKGYYTEMCDPKNEGKTAEQIKSVVFKNLEKNPIYYTEKGQFGIKDLGYTTEAPGLGTPKEPKGPHKSSGYGTLNEDHNPGDKVIYKGTRYEVVEEDETTITLKDEKGNIIKKNYNQFKKGEYKGDVKEQSLRKAIREIVDCELDEMRGGGNYGILNINPSGGGGGRRFIPNVINMPLSLRKRFGDHMVYNPASETFYVSQILYNNLIKGYADQPTIKKLIMDISPMLKQLLNKTENYGQPTELPKQFKMYLPFKEPVQKAKEDKFNKKGTKQYWAAGDFLFPNLNKEKYAPEEIEENYESLDYYVSVIKSNNFTEDEAYNFLEDQGLGSMEVESIIRQAFSINESKQEQLLRKIIRESVEKEIAAINKEAELEILDTKLEKINSAIEKRQSQLTRLDEDEDMKALTDKNKVKQIQKDIKTLEKAKAKIEKQLSKKDKVKKEVIDEDEPIEEAIDDQKVDKVKTSLEDIDKKVTDISAKTKDMFENEEELPQDILNTVVEKFAETGGDVDMIPVIAASFPTYEKEIIKFLEGYDLGLDYDI